MTIAQVLRMCAGIVAAIIFYLAGTDMREAGSAMRELESVSGTSVAEAYYNESGVFTEALGLFAWGMAALAVLFALPLTWSFGGAAETHVEASDVEEEIEDVNDREDSDLQDEVDEFERRLPPDIVADRG